MDDAMGAGDTHEQQQKGLRAKHLFCIYLKIIYSILLYSPRLTLLPIKSGVEREKSYGKPVV
jgi:hypothetical protein